MITGDFPATAQTIARAAGVSAETVLTVAQKNSPKLSTVTASKTHLRMLLTRSSVGFDVANCGASEITTPHAIASHQLAEIDAAVQPTITTDLNRKREVPHELLPNGLDFHIEAHIGWFIRQSIQFDGSCSR